MTDFPTDAAVARLMNEAVTDGALDLSIGEPDQPLPGPLRQVAVDSLLAGEVGYTAKAGLVELRGAIASSLPGEVDIADVVVTVGGTEAVAVALAAACTSGDTIVIPDPAWPNYRVLGEQLGLRIATYRQGANRDDFMDLEEIAAHLAAGARMVVVNSPSNPMAAVASKAQLATLVGLVAAHGAVLLSDEAYEGIVFDGGRAPSPLSIPGGPEVTFVARTFSKTYSMTGLRVGSLASPPSFRHAVAAVHGTIVGCAPHTAQRVALSALETMPDRGTELSTVYRSRFARALEVLGPWMLADGPEGHGGFYVWLDGRSTGLTANELASRVESLGVRVSSGNAYTVSESHAIRLALTAGGEDLERALHAARSVLSEGSAAT
ncbi:pyridoxal phosphate-dependent aminotransferase [Demequina sp. NBRC 110054]|uniref:pyridoxal phosphate-dependent aminotransferase n=1 Tax=Demequina sp. NBRC 110054 TaxID=1570343 RepID=UPI000A072280|nr:pyridoxal phosphate-dependent aminotransferase [Demequina sp. NBRC 110054]